MRRAAPAGALVPFFAAVSGHTCGRVTNATRASPASVRNRKAVLAEGRVGESESRAVSGCRVPPVPQTSSTFARRDNDNNADGARDYPRFWYMCVTRTAARTRTCTYTRWCFLLLTLVLTTRRPPPRRRVFSARSFDRRMRSRSTDPLTSRHPVRCTEGAISNRGATRSPRAPV